MTKSISATISRINGNCITLGKENLFINEVVLDGLKEYDEVIYTKSGSNLVTIEKYTPPAETKTGGGKITVLDLLNSALEYTYFWQGAPATGKIFQFSEEVKPKLGKYHVGDEVTLTWTVLGNKKTLIDIGPKQVKKGGGRPFDPVADAKRQRLIVRQSCLERALTLHLARSADEITQSRGVDQVSSITGIAEEFEKWVMRE